MKAMRNVLRTTCIFWALLLGLLSSQVGLAQTVPTIGPVGPPIKVLKPFSFDQKTRRAVSGITCSKSSGSSRCLIAFDEGVQAQFALFESSGLRSIGDPFDLLSSGKELDAEGAASDGNYLYVVGSHSVKRKNCKSNPSSHHLIRLKARWKEASSSLHDPIVAIGDLARSTRLWDSMRADPYLKDYADGCLGAVGAGASHAPGDSLGLNIEGMAARQGRLYFGFRGPSVDGVVPVFSVAADALFTGADAMPKLVKLKLGTGFGVRDMVPTESSMLLLIGPNDADTAGESKWVVAEWKNPMQSNLRVLAAPGLRGVTMDSCSKEVKPEAIAVLDEMPTLIRVLVMSDGLCDGGPLVFDLPR